MVFKRPASSGNRRSDRSTHQASRPAGRPRKASGSTENSSRGDGQSDKSHPFSKFSKRQPDEKRPSSSGRKSFGAKPGEGDQTERPRSNFSSSSARPPFAGKKRPYDGRTPDNGDRPKRTGNYSSRDASASNDRPKRPGNFSSRNASTNEERPKRAGNYGSRAGSANEDRPKRAGNYGSREDSPRDKKPFEGGNKFSKKSVGDGSKPAGSFSTPRPLSAGSSRPEGTRALKTDNPDNTKPEYTKPAYGERKPTSKMPARAMRGRKKASTEEEETGLIRLNRYIANAGICSRRKADELIAAGVVAVNGIVISELGFKVDPRKDEIRYNGETLKREKMVYVLLNKPKDYITTTEDPQERRTVMHLVEKASKERIYPIGRLDRNTTGLLLMTNDGDLADKLSHPRNNIVKLYQVELSKSLTQGDLNKIGFGVELEDGFIKPDTISYVTGGTKREIGIQIHSGKNRVVRRIFEALGYEVVKLDRVVYANLTKKDLPRGRWRYLEESEIIQLKHLI